MQWYRAQLNSPAAVTIGMSLLLLSALQLTAASMQPAGGDATAILLDAAGQQMGMATFEEEGNHLRIWADLGGLPPGFHGFHIHANGVCDPSTGFQSAGGHLNPAEMLHPAHAGDMPSLYVHHDGTASLRFTTDSVTMADLLVDGGRAVIIHADPDNFAHIPARYGVTVDQTTLNTGDAGDRIACGVVGPP
jgi:superoxide dismutase, Cu-Zn family